MDENVVILQKYNLMHQHERKLKKNSQITADEKCFKHVQRCFHCFSKILYHSKAIQLLRTVREVRSFGRCAAFVVPSPNCPSSLSPQVQTSPLSVQTTQCREPQATETTRFPSKASIILGRRTWSSVPCPSRKQSPLPLEVEKQGINSSEDQNTLFYKKLRFLFQY